ncbi:hypothetical protein ES703_85972 [subsurface metagenome]
MDNFNDNSNEWSEQEGEVYISDGKFNFNPSETIFVDFWEEGVINGKIAVKIRHVDDIPNGFFGILIRHTENDDEYHFLLSGDGFFAFGRGTATDTESLVEWEKSDFMDPEKENLIEIEFIGRHVQGYINSEKAFEVYHSYLEKGSLAFLASEGCRVQIDDLKVWDYEERDPNVHGDVELNGDDAEGVEVKAYEVLDIDTMSVALVDQTVTDEYGEYEFYLLPDRMYIIEAGVSEKEWQEGKGNYGARFVDLSIPKEGIDLDIPLH